MNKQTNKYTFSRLLFTEVKFQLTFGKLLSLAITAIVVPFVIYYLRYVIGGFGNNALDTQSLLLSATGAVVIFMISRNMIAVQSKATVDKNKAAFMLYGKNKVTFSKLIIESILFTTGFFVVFGMSTLMYLIYDNKVDFGEYTTVSLVMLPGFLVLHIFINTIATWVISFIPKKGLAYAAAFFITLILIAPVWILNQIPATSTLQYAFNAGVDVNDDPRSGWMGQNQDIIRFIPIINNGLISGVKHNFGPKLPQLVREWDIIFPILMDVAFLAAVWNLQSSAQKRYLAAS